MARCPNDRFCSLLFWDPTPNSSIGFAASEELRGMSLKHLSPYVLCEDCLPKGQQKDQCGDKRKGVLLFHTYEQLQTPFLRHIQNLHGSFLTTCHPHLGPHLPHTCAHTQTATDTVHPMSSSASPSVTHTDQTWGTHSLKI